MLHTIFQASKPSGSEVEDFLIFFYVFLWLEPMTTGQRPENKLGRGLLGNATYQISNIWAMWF